MKTKILLIAILFLISVIPVSAQEEACVYFFYGDGCPHCERVEPLLLELENKYPEFEIKWFEVYHDSNNAFLLEKYFDVFNVDKRKRGVPVVFISDKYLLGDKPILQNLENEIINYNGVHCPNLEQGGTGISGDTAPLTKYEAVSLLTVAGAALVDSINPCAIAVLLILLASLFLAGGLGNAKRALKSGFAFITSIYIVYFLFGIGVFALLRQAMIFWGPSASILRIVVGSFAIIIGLLNIKDYLWYGAGGFAMEIPARWRPKLKRLLHSVTSPLGAFIIGFLVSAFELPCTGGPYFFALAYLADKATYASLIPILLFYNLIFVLPLIIINLLMYYGVTSVEQAEEWKNRNLKNIHLITGLIMIALGIVLVLGLI